MELSIPMRIIYNVKHRYESFFEIWTLILNFSNQVNVRGSICSTVNENLLLYCRKFKMFVVVII